MVYENYLWGVRVKILVIPDTQVKPSVNIDHLVWAGNYIKAKRPDVVLAGGDWWDLPSLSSYDAGKRSAENRRFNLDVEAGNAALSKMTRIFESKTYSPRKVMLRGNHENRIERYVDDNPRLEDTVGYHLFNDVSLGWKPEPFLKVVSIGGVRFSHFFPRGANGKIVQTKHGAPNARVQAIREGASCVGFHAQGLDSAIVHTGTRTLRGIICGSFYSHQESYLSPQGTNYWRGILMLHEVRNGNFSLCEVTLEYLRRRYG